MKTLFSRPPGRITAILVVLTLAFMNADAQYKGNRFRKPNFYIGVEGAMGTRSFSIKSDIAAINGMKALEEGYSLGAVLGGRTLLTKVKTGFFKPLHGIGLDLLVCKMRDNPSGGFTPLSAIRKDGDFHCVASRYSVVKVGWYRRDRR